MFSPKAEGTIRTLSERLYFLIFPALFGLNVVPFKVWTFLTELANIALLIKIAGRLTGSPLAGFLAAILWSANAGFALALGWSSAYNEIAFGFVILLAFRLFSGTSTPASENTGFGSGSYSWSGSGSGDPIHCRALRVHRRAGRSSLQNVLRKYTDDAVDLLGVHGDWAPEQPNQPTNVLVGHFRYGRHHLALVFFAVIKLRLRDDFSEYYVVVPPIGLAILGAWALASARGGPAVIVGMLAAVYIALSIASLHTTEKYLYNRAHPMKYIVQDLEALPMAETSKAILIDGIDNELFRSGISRFVIGCDDALSLLTNHQAVVLELKGRELSDITGRYLARVHFALDHPEFVAVADPLYRNRLGPTWY